MALKEQKLEFVEIQLKDVRIQLEESNKQHQTMVDAMKRHQEDEENPNDSDASNQMSESPTRADRLQRKVDELTQQLNSAQESGQEAELQLKLYQTESERVSKEQQARIEDSEKERQALQGKIKDYELSKDSTLDQIEKKYKQDLERLEKELEDKQNGCEHETKLIQQRSEESLAQLKNFYE